MQVLKIIKSSPAFVFPAVINLVSLVAFTRLLTLENYGQLSLALVSVELLQGVLYSWVSMAMMRFYESEKGTGALGVGLHFAAGITGGLLLAGGLVAGWGGHFLGLSAGLVAAILLGVVGRGVGNYVQDCYRMHYPDLTPYTWVTVAANASFYLPAIAFLVWRRQSTTTELLLVQAGGLLLFLLVMGIRHQRVVVQQLRLLRAKPAYVEFLGYGLPLVVSFISLSMFLRIDRFIVQHNVGAQALGAYSAAFSLSNLTISSFFLVLTLPTYPEILKKFNDGQTEAATAIYHKNGRIILLVGGPLLLFSYFFNAPLCRLFFGAEKGGDVAALFPWVVLSTFLFNYKVHYFDQLYQFYKRTRVAMYLGIGVGLGHLGLGYVLSKEWGARGVSASGMVLNGLAIAYTLYYSRFYLGQPSKSLALPSS